MSHFILAIEMQVHVFWLPVIVLLSVLAGMMYRKLQLKKASRQILSLENEMMTNHAEILRLQHKLAAIEKASHSTATPVVPLKEEKNDQPDVGVHKKIN